LGIGILSALKRLLKQAPIFNLLMKYNLMLSSFYKTGTVLTFLAVSASWTGCSEDDNSVNCDYQKEMADFEAKLDNFSNDPTTTSCNSLRQSAITLLNRLDGCPGDQGVKQALQQWRDIDCSAFGS
jgi:hypothetical protein